jgi:hypothetical protein
VAAVIDYPPHKYADEPAEPIPLRTLQPATDEAGLDWTPRDLTSYLDGTFQPPTPSLLRRQDGACLMYRGRVHWISGEPEAGKSWLGLLACAQELWAGRQVVYVDWEDGPEGITRRLLDLDVDAAVIRERFHYVQPESALGPMRRERLQPWVEASSLLVIDACTESLAQQGLSSKDDTDIAQWLDILPRWAARLGPAIAVLDHVVKDADSRGRWATGSQHKLAGLDGVAYAVETVHPAGRGLTGRSRLFVSKDRHGQVRGPLTAPSAGHRHWAGDLVIDSGLMLEVVVHPPTHTQPGEVFRPTVLMERISEVLAAAGRPLSSREVEDRVSGKAQHKRQALAALVDDGHVEVVLGHHNSKQHRLVKPFPAPEETS